MFTSRWWFQTSECAWKLTAYSSRLNSNFWEDDLRIPTSELLAISRGTEDRMTPSRWAACNRPSIFDIYHGILVIILRKGLIGNKRCAWLIQSQLKGCSDIERWRCVLCNISCYTFWQGDIDKREDMNRRTEVVVRHPLFHEWTHRFVPVRFGMLESACELNRIRQLAH